jgi:hypothetical protein
MRNADRILVGKPVGNRPFRRPSHRLEGNIKINLREIGWKDVDWIHLALDREGWHAIVSMVMNPCFP